MPSYSQESKKANLAKQAAMIEEGKRKHAQMEADIMSKAGEDFQRRFFNMSRSERLQYGLRMSPPPPDPRYKKPRKEYVKIVEMWSKCCKEEAYCRKRINFGGNKPPEETFRCKKCYNDCEIQRTMPRSWKRAKRKS